MKIIFLQELKLKNEKILQLHIIISNMKYLQWHYLLIYTYYNFSLSCKSLHLFYYKKINFNKSFSFQ